MSDEVERLDWRPLDEARAEMWAAWRAYTDALAKVNRLEGEASQAFAAEFDAAERRALDRLARGEG